MNVYEVTFIDWLGSDIENKYLHADILHFFPFSCFLYHWNLQSLCCCASL